MPMWLFQKPRFHYALQDMKRPSMLAWCKFFKSREKERSDNNKYHHAWDDFFESPLLSEPTEKLDFKKAMLINDIFQIQRQSKILARLTSQAKKNKHHKIKISQNGNKTFGSQKSRLLILNSLKN